MFARLKKIDVVKRPIIGVVSLKFSLLVCCIIVTAMAVMAGLVLQNARESLLKKLELDTVVYARESREAFFPEPNKFQLHFSTLKAAKLDGVDYAFVVDKEGTVLSHSTPMFIGEAVNVDKIKNQPEIPQIINDSITKSGGKFKEISAPIVIEGFFVGMVSLGLSENSISKALRETYRKIIFIALAVLAGSFILTILIVNIMVQPVSELAKAAYQVGQGNLNYKLNIKQKDEFGFLGQKFNDMITGLKERDFIRDTFGKYVTKEVARAVLNGGLQLGGEKRTVTILVTDLRDFTKMSEKLPPEEVVELINRYFKVMVRIISKYEGTLDKYIGDSILAIYGAPLNVEDHARKAVLSALEMQEALVQLNKDFIREKKPAIAMGIAINSGEVLVGNIGSEERMEYTAIGDAVNTAVRIEGLNKELCTEFLISENVYAEAKHLLDVEDKSYVKLRGKQAGIRIYSVLNRKKSERDTSSLVCG